MAATPRRVTIIRVLWVVGFLVGTTTHVTDLVLDGTDVYSRFPTAARLYWVALTLFDPLAIVLVILRLRAGVVLAVVIMVSDVAVNSVMVATHGLPVFGLVNQILFGLLVAATAPLLWRWSRQRTGGVPAP